MASILRTSFSGIVAVPCRGLAWVLWGLLALGCGAPTARQGRAEGPLRDGVRHGRWEAEHFGGGRAWAGRYDHGRPVGRWRWWREDGTLEEVSTWRDSLRHGPCRYFGPDGGLEAEGAYRDGLRQGPWAGYHPDGAKAWEGAYEAGRKHGPWRAWYPDGAAEAFGEFDRGSGPETGFHPNGSLHFRGAWRDGKRHGVWTWYDASGEREREAVYAEGRLVQEG